MENFKKRIFIILLKSFSKLKNKKTVKDKKLIKYNNIIVPFLPNLVFIIQPLKIPTKTSKE